MSSEPESTQSADNAIVNVNDGRRVGASQEKKDDEDFDVNVDDDVSDSPDDAPPQKKKKVLKVKRAVGRKVSRFFIYIQSHRFFQIST